MTENKLRPHKKHRKYKITTDFLSERSDTTFISTSGKILCASATH